MPQSSPSTIIHSAVGVWMKSEAQRWYPLSIVLTAAGYASYALSKAVFLLFGLPVAVLLAPFPDLRKRVLQALIHRYLGFFTRTWLPFLRVYRVAEISGLENALQLRRAAVIVANHRGFMDGIFMLGLVPHTGVLIKARDTRPLTYAFLERQFDLIGVDRNSFASVAGALERCRELLRRETNLLVFPEGTRARSGRLQLFNRLAFDLAVVANVPLLPVIIHSTCPFMARLPGSIFPRGRNICRIRFLRPEIPEAGDSATALCDRVHRRMARELETLDAGTCWEREATHVVSESERALSYAQPNPTEHLHEQQGTL